MCNVCGFSHCKPTCPENMDYDPVFARCDRCGGEIYFGADYYRIEDYLYCEDCILGERRVAGD